MRTAIAWATALCVLACWAGIGCDAKPGPLRDHWGRVIEHLVVDTADGEEMQAAIAMEKARLNYQFRLKVLKGYYQEAGVAGGLKAAAKELENLNEAQWFTVTGTPAIQPPEGMSVEAVGELMLVEATNAARNAYKQSLVDLHKLYTRKNQTKKAQMLRRVAERYDFVRTYTYLPEAEIPGENLRPVEVIPEADTLYADALRLHEVGKLIPLAPDYGKQRKALESFLRLVWSHPRSTKIALSAFYIGEIYKEYFNENERAVRWYERAWQWDPRLTKPARFQAAVVLDLRLHDYEKALEVYKEVVLHEKFNPSNVAYAYERINKLSKMVQRGE